MATDLGCTATIIPTNYHNHPPDPVRVEAVKILTVIKQRVQRSAINNYTQNIPLAVATALLEDSWAARGRLPMETTLEIHGQNYSEQLGEQFVSLEENDLYISTSSPR